MNTKLVYTSDVNPDMTVPDPQYLINLDPGQ